MGKQTNTVTPNPPIFTADEHIINVGDILYGVDTACNDKAFPTVTPLQVIQLYLGSFRRVSLRKKNGIEWSWSPKEEKGTCKTAEHLLYYSFEQAKKAAIEAASVTGDEDDIKKAERNVLSAKRDLKDYEDELHKLKNNPNAKGNKLAVLKKSKQPTVTFAKLPKEVTELLRD